MIQLHRLRRRLLAAQIVREFKGVDDKELDHLKRKLQKPILEDKWRKQREAKVDVIKAHRRSAEDLLKKREELEQRWIEADRKDNIDESVQIRANLDALEWVIGGKDVL